MQGPHQETSMTRTPVHSTGLGLRQNFKGIYSVDESSSKPIGKCGDCGKIMVLIDAHKPYLRCATCSKDHQTPRHDSLTKQSFECPICHYSIVFATTKQPTNKQYFCPKCYESKNEFMKRDRQYCSNCFNKECPYSTLNTRIALCDCHGSFCFVEYRKKPYAFCSWCYACMKFNNSDVSSVQLTEKLCRNCHKCKVVSITLSKGKTINGCCNCDAGIKKLISITQAKKKK